METLAYLHLVLANEAQADMDYTTSTRESKNKGYRISTQSHFSTLAVVNLLPVAVTLLSIFGIAGHASALVQKGDQGTEVTAIQQRLKELGYFKGSATGYYGPVTKRAVTRFQQNKGLAADGIVGKNTSAALDLGEETELSASVSEPSDIATTPITIIVLCD